MHLEDGSELNPERFYGMGWTGFTIRILAWFHKRIGLSLVRRMASLHGERMFTAPPLVILHRPTIAPAMEETRPQPISDVEFGGYVARARSGDRSTRYYHGRRSVHIEETDDE